MDPEGTSRDNVGFHVRDGVALLIVNVTSVVPEAYRSVAAAVALTTQFPVPV